MTKGTVTKLKVIMEGPLHHGGLILLSDFRTVVETAGLLLKQVAFEQFSQQERKRLGLGEHLGLVVAHLSHSSPVMVELGFLNDDVAGMLFPSVGAIRDKIMNGKSDEISDKTLRYLEKTVAPLNKGGIQKMEWIFASEKEKLFHWPMDEEFARRIKDAREADWNDYTTVEGYLELLDIHQNKPKFRVYSRFPGVPEVECTGDSELRKTVIEMMDRKVAVSGRARYRPQSPFPHKMEVEHIDSFPENEKIPSLWEMHGIAPELADGKNAADYIAELRDE